MSTENKSKQNFLQRIAKKYVNRETILYVVFGTGTTIVNLAATFLLMKAPFTVAWGQSIYDSNWFASISQIAWLNYFHELEPSGITFLVINVIAWLIAVLFAFVTNKIFVFESRSWRFGKLMAELGSFMLARIISLLFEELFLLVTVTLGGMNEMLAKILAGIFVIIMNYFASKLLIFKKKENN